MSILTFLSLLGFAAPASSQTPTFSDDFSSGKLDLSKWTVATYKSPDSNPGINAGVYAPETITFVPGAMRIEVTQKKGSGGVVESTGGCIYSKEYFGFGTYVFVMRMSTTSPTPDGAGETLTGAVSSGFLYNTNSESEIDLEFLGNDNAIHVTNWHNPTPANPPTGDIRQTEKLKNKFLGTQFRTYTLVWTPDKIQVFIDGTLVVSHKNHVPQKPARIVLQHRGTNSNGWGGTASVGVSRFAYFKSVSFTPLGK
jgi:beta-glucanase (GH16 family)